MTIATHRAGSDEPENSLHKQNHKNYPAHPGFAFLVWMGMAPIPVIGLFSLAGPREFVGLFVIVGQVDSPGVVLVIVPIMVILVIGIIDSDLNAVVIRSGGGHNCHRGRKNSSQ